MTPKINAALQQLQNAFQETFQGEDIPFSTYDVQKKMFILVIAGEQAEHYYKVVKAIQDFATSESQLATHKLVEALNREQQGGS